MDATTKQFLEQMQATLEDSIMSSRNASIARHEVLVQKLELLASVQASSGTSVVGPVPASSGTAELVTAAVVATDASSSTAKDPEVLQVALDAPPVCIEMVPVTSSMACPTQVVTNTDVDPKAGVQELDALSVNTNSVTSEVDHGVVHIVSSDLTAPTLTKCSAKCSRRDTNLPSYVFHPAATPSGLELRPLPWPSFAHSQEGGQLNDDRSLESLVGLLHYWNLMIKFLGLTPSCDTNYGEYKIIPELHATSSCTVVNSQIFPELRLLCFELPVMERCWIYVPLIGAIGRLPQSTGYRQLRQFLLGRQSLTDGNGRAIFTYVTELVVVTILPSPGIHLVVQPEYGAPVRQFCPPGPIVFAKVCYRLLDTHEQSASVLIGETRNAVPYLDNQNDGELFQWEIAWLFPMGFLQQELLFCICYSLPSTNRMASVIPNQKKGTSNLKDISPFSVLSSSSGIVPWVDSDVDSGRVTGTSDSKTDGKVSAELVSDWEDLDDNDLQNQFCLRSNPDEVSQYSSYKTVADVMELWQCNPLVASPVNGASQSMIPLEEEMFVNSHDGIGGAVQNEPDGVGVQLERSSILNKLKELGDLRQQDNESLPCQCLLEETQANSSLPNEPLYATVEDNSSFEQLFFETTALDLTGIQKLVRIIDGNSLVYLQGIQSDTSACPTISLQGCSALLQQGAVTHVVQLNSVTVEPNSDMPAEVQQLRQQFHDLFSEPTALPPRRDCDHKIELIQKRTAREFSIGQKVFLKMQPYVQGSVAVRANHKLCFKFFGPFPIIGKAGSAAYRLQLPEKSQIHPVFHVSQMKKALLPHRQVSSALPTDSGALMVPVKFLEHSWHQNGNHHIRQVLTQWSHRPASELLWEDVEELQTRFPAAPAWGQAVAEEEGGVSNLANRASPTPAQPTSRPKIQPAAPLLKQHTQTEAGILAWITAAAPWHPSCSPSFPLH